MKSEPHSGPDQLSDTLHWDTDSTRAAIQSSDGWKPLMGGLLSLMTATMIMSYFNLFIVPYLVVDLENRNVSASQNLIWMIEVFGMLIRNWHWITGVSILTFCVQQMACSHSHRQYARQILGGALMMGSLVATIWVLLTMLIGPN
ncbi:MAG: hypothetical protein JNL67_18580 [Planctomycetaceae bacterium]|nr:hypothetical protein [Planctomycetaceae bacterium]